MSTIVVPNTNPNLELVEVHDFDDNLGQHVRYQPIVAWAVDPEHPECPATPITADARGPLWGLHDRETDHTWVPETQWGSLHDTLAYLRWGGKEGGGDGRS